MKKKVVLFIFIVLISAISFYTFNQIIPGINLHKTILNALSGARGKYSVVVKDLKSEKGESLYGDKVYDIGSLYKLWVMAEVFEQKCEQKLIQPTVIYDYPTETSPLAKKCKNPRYVERFEHYVTGMESSNNYSELNDPIDLGMRFSDERKKERLGEEEAHQTDKDFIE
ncbi:MAG: Lysine-tRNA ligase, partial [Candidatus Levybacteria bacterium GW2011_GWC2_37_7]